MRAQGESKSISTGKLPVHVPWVLCFWVFGGTTSKNRLSKCIISNFQKFRAETFRPSPGHWSLTASRPRCPDPPLRCGEPSSVCYTNFSGHTQLPVRSSLQMAMREVSVLAQRTSTTALWRKPQFFHPMGQCNANVQPNQALTASDLSIC